MKKVKIEVYLGVGFAGCDRRDTLEFEVEENATNEEIEAAAEEMARDWAFNFLDWGFQFVDGKEAGKS